MPFWAFYAMPTHHLIVIRQVHHKQEVSEWFAGSFVPIQKRLEIHKMRQRGKNGKIGWKWTYPSFVTDSDSTFERTPMGYQATTSEWSWQKGEVVASNISATKIRIPEISVQPWKPHFFSGVNSLVSGFRCILPKITFFKVMWKAKTRILWGQKLDYDSSDRFFSFPSETVGL